MIESKNTMSLLMVMVTFTWALSGIATKYLSFYISENEIVVYRYFFAVLSTFPVLWWMKIPLNINKKNLLLSILLAIFLIGNTRFYFMGMQHGAAGLGAALVTVLIPIFVYIFMVFFKKSQPTLREWFALLFGIMGVSFMMNFEQLSLSEWMRGGNLYFVLAAFFYALITVFGAFMRDMHVMAFNFYICIFALVIDWFLSFDGAFLSEVNMDQVFWINIFILSVLSTTIAATLYYIGLKVLGSKKCSEFSLLTPFFAIALGALFFGETLTIKNALGTIMAVSALVMLNNIKFKDLTNFR